MKHILFALLAFSCIRLSAQKTVLDVENNNDYSSFSVLDSAYLSQFTLFFTGEDHRYLKSNSQLELKMFKHLHKTAGVRVFMMEFGYSLGYAANKYVQTGDSNILNLLDKHTYDEYFELFKSLRDFYDSLPENEKFSLAAVDLEREPVYPVKMLESLLPENSTPHDSIKLHIDALKAISEYHDYESAKNEDEEDEYDDIATEKPGSDSAYTKVYVNTRFTVELVIENYKKHKEKYQAYLGSNFDLFETEVKNIEDYFVYDSYEGAAHQYIFRENYMEQNVRKLVAQNPEAKVFGQFGRCHTQRTREKEDCSYFYFNSLATRLNTTAGSPFEGKVFSCAVFYPAMFDFMDDNVSINAGLDSLINNTELNTISLTVLGKEDSTFVQLSKRFNAVIINYNETDDNSAEGVEETMDISSLFDPNNKERIMFLATAGAKGMNISNINNRLKTDFNPSVQFYGLEFNFSKNRKYSLINRFTWFSTGTQKINDSASVALSGFNINFMYGGDLIKSNSIDFILSGGYGYEHWEMQTTETHADESRKDVFGSNRTTTYTNPGMYLNAAADLRINKGRFTFGVYGGYQLDLSNQKWRTAGKLNGDTPKFSLSSYTIGANLGFNIPL